MARSSWMHGLLWLMPLWLWSMLASGVRADESRVVLWVAGSESDGRERERALRLELEARGILLLVAEADAQAGADAEQSAEALARQLLARSEAAAVLWLEGDAARPVSWLRVIHRQAEAVEQAPLPHPPAAIEPELFALAAASLLEQVLESSAAPPAAPQADLQVKPDSAAAPAPAPAQPQRAAQAPSAVTAQPATDAREPEAANWFVQAALSLSIADVRSGMEASSRPTLDEIFVMENGRFFFDDSVAWVPDADSFDDYESPQLGIPRGRTPAAGNCPADGQKTGPVGVTDADGEEFTQLEPSSYCARVETPGFKFVPALRVVLGRWLLPRFALGVAYQWHFGIEPTRFLGNQQFGLHAEYLVLGTRGRPVTFSFVSELTVGRTETPAPSPRLGRSVNVLSGPFGISGGGLLRVSPVAAFALFASPTVGTRFPTGQFTADLAAGAELSF